MATTHDDNVNLDNPANVKNDFSAANNAKVTQADHPELAKPVLGGGAAGGAQAKAGSGPVTAKVPAETMILEIGGMKQPGAAVVPPGVVEPPVFDVHAETVRDPAIEMVGDSTSHHDPFSGESGIHPVGVGIGAAAGGAAVGAATGLAVGAVAGPLGAAFGTAAGAVVGAIAGGYAGKEVAERVHPTTENHYWRSVYRTRPYVARGSRYEDYEPAYLHGIQMRERLIDLTWEQAEEEIHAAWNKNPHAVAMNWERARPAVQDSWDHLTPEPAEPEATEAEKHEDE